MDASKAFETLANYLAANNSGYVNFISKPDLNVFGLKLFNRHSALRDIDFEVIKDAGFKLTKVESDVDPNYFIGNPKEKSYLHSLSFEYIVN